MSKYRAKKVLELIKETAGGAGGAGYAVWGGGQGRTFGNPSMKGFMTGRGFGFGASNTTGGPNVMYTYSIVPLNHELEQERTTQTKQEKYIHKGSLVRGRPFNSKEEVVGLVVSIQKDSDDNIQYYEVLDEETGIISKLDPTTVYIHEQEQYIQPSVFDHPGKYGGSTWSREQNESFSLKGRKKLNEDLNDKLKGPSKEEVEKKAENMFPDDLLRSALIAKSPKMIRKAAEKFYKYQEEEDEEEFDIILKEEIIDLLHGNEIEIFETLANTGLLRILSDDHLYELKKQAKMDGLNEIAEIIKQVL